MIARTLSVTVTSRFYNHFSIIPNHYSCKICPKYLGIKMLSAVSRQEETVKFEDLSSSSDVVHKTTEQFISRRR